MKTNDLKKGDNIILNCGWKATIMDNKKGNVRLARVYGNYEEVGSVYAYDIMQVEKDGNYIRVEHTEAQLKHKRVVKELMDKLRG